MAANPVQQPEQSLAVQTLSLTAAEIRAHVNLIQEVMRAVMKDGTHYGIIPGCKKPSLWKPGAEVLCMTFHISVDPVVEDLSTRDEARFRVVATGRSSSGFDLGSAVGEASSSEEKYKWREVVCDEEWDSTPEDERRNKWKRSQHGAYAIRQVRTQIADSRNTILKMAVKRAVVALALQVTAASDIFTQDIEDIPEESRAAVAEETTGPQPVDDLPTEIKRKPVQTSAVPESRTSQPRSAPVEGAAARVAPSAAAPPVYTQRRSNDEMRHAPAPAPSPRQAQTISEQQGRRFYAIWKNSGKSKEEVSEYLHNVLGIQSDRDMPVSRYQEACTWAERPSGERW